ncbi:class I SAM-dependent methyltransferase [Phenylobacterium sp. 58.2.17]|uniref:class I SAM-dependent methyltransferase n=1 Tax=Phenylobacterium sp. 58.2.17 TaxID=2969306 RepID=UPI0022654020|nr:class I SAM-dependent methyltransferase [Phenylobacterium sp. 58.2.17]MCX7586357.1 class I SAM-dependent methyltransferase [Phenylobacterium sp. 58.2.17]
MSQTQSPAYDQPTKALARRRSLTHAIELVTSRREAAAIVPADHVERVRQALLNSDTWGDTWAGDNCDPKDIASWRSFRAAAIGTRTPQEITVAYLAGPEPDNDLEVLLELGVRPENIWAFEVDKKIAAQGLDTLRDLKARGVKFIPASIEDYFIATPRRFDIIYFDACGPFPSRNSDTARVLATLFRHSALAPLGVLVSNFARPDINKSEELTRFSFLIGAYLYPKSFLESENGGSVEGPEAYGFLFNPSAELTDEWSDSDPPADFLDEVKANFERYYGLFITRSIMDLATIVAPTARLLSGDLWKIAFDKDLTAAIARGRRLVIFNEEAFKSGDDEGDAGADHMDSDGDAIVHSDFNSLLWTLAACGYYAVDLNFGAPPTDAKTLFNPWRNALIGKPAGGGYPLEDLMAVYYAWRHDPQLWSEAMRRIADFPYREEMPFLCDVPTQELGFYPAFAQLAYPTHPNVRETRRFRYVAEGKQTPMFMDVIAFDECRYVYDWLSALHLTPEDWGDLSAQLTFRFALDGIAKDKRWMGDDFLYGCHVVGENADFPTGDLQLREDLSPGEPQLATPVDNDPPPPAC